MSQLKLKLLYLMIFLVYTQGMWERIFFFSSFIQYIVDGSILAFILFQFKYNFRAPASSVFLFLCISALLIGYINSEPFTETFLYLRYIIYTYLIYNQLFSKPLTLNNWSTILKMIIAMIFLQGFGALYNIFILGDRVEGYVGLMSSLGGTTATIFPLLISTLIMVVYLCIPRIDKKTLLILALILMSSLLVGYSSGKRGIYFIIPFILFLTTIITIPKILGSGHFKRKLLGLTSFGVLIFPLLIFGMVNSRGLNYSLSGNESSFEVIASSLDYANEYESATDQYGNTIGRSNTTTRIIENSLANPYLLFLGTGYGSIKEEETMFKLGYGYGIVGFTRDLISGGFFLSFLTILLFIRMIKVNKSIKIKFSSIIRSSMVLVFLYTQFFYSSDFTVSLKITLILVILLALINSPVHRNSLIILLKKNKILK